MPAGISNQVRLLRQLALAGQAAGPTDGQLLDCFLRTRQEAAFHALVKRHGPMVFGVCRRILGHTHDAEDAFQATFLVLVRKAATIQPREAVGNWLYGVACRTALKARALRARRSAREKLAPTMKPPTRTEEPPADDWQPILDQELAGLPDKYRLPIVLCDLEGKTAAQVARTQRIPIGTVFSRLARGRALLRQRLVRRGLTMAVGALPAALANHATAAVPPALFQSTLKAGLPLAAGQPLPAAVSPQVGVLLHGVLTTMLLTRLKLPLLGLFLVSLAAMAIGLARQPIAGAQPRTLPVATAHAKTRAATRRAPAPADLARAKSLLREAQGALEKIKLPETGMERFRAAEDKTAFLAAIAVAQSRLGEARTAARTWAQALEFSGQQSGAGLFEIACRKASHGDRKGALEVARQEARLAGKDAPQPGLLQAIARELAQHGHYAPARAVARTIPDEGLRLGTFYLIAQAQLERGALDAAWQTLQEIPEANRVFGLVGSPYHVQSADDLALGIALSQAARKLPDLARQTIERALKLVPKLTNEVQRDWALAAIARTQARIGEPAAAAKTAEQIKADEPRKSAGAGIVIALAHRGQFKQARTAMATLDDPSLKTHVLAALAGRLAKAGDRAEARKVFQQALQTSADIQPVNARNSALHSLATAEASASEFAEALRAAQAQTRQENNLINSFTYSAIAHQQARAGDYKGALQTADKVWWASEKARVLQEIALRQTKAGQWPAALKQAQAQADPLLKAATLLGIARGLARAN
jgi:RNA polymerase sigma factor (sigma-70 family)